MDFFEKIKQPAKFETPVIEERDHPNKGSTHSAETRAKISAAKKGKPGKTRSAEHCAKLSAAMKGKTRSAEARAKISAGNKGKTLTAETRAKISAARKGRPGNTHSAETRAKISASNAKSRACRTPLGVFRSLKEATRAHNVHTHTVRNRCLNNKFSDWHFVDETE